MSNPEMVDTIYLDNNATTFIIPEVKERIIEIINKNYGNPSSPHSLSYFANEIISNAKKTISSFINCYSDQIIFTGSGSESNNQILKSVLSWNYPNGIIVSKIEDSSVLKSAEYLRYKGIDVSFINVDNKGIIDLDHLKKELKSRKYKLVSVGVANSETGIIQPIKDIIELTHKYNAFIHLDATQSVGKIMLNFNNLNIDFITFSGHKLHAPQGIAVLVAKNIKHLFPLIHGGNQEYSKRAGTENIIGIGALDKAIEIRSKNFHDIVLSLKKMRDLFENELKNNINNIFINGDITNRLPNVSNICFKNTDGQAILYQLDSLGIICSQTSACTSQTPEPSHVLTAMGLSENDAYNTIRFSFGVNNNISQIDYISKQITTVVNKIRALNPEVIK